MLLRLAVGANKNPTTLAEWHRLRDCLSCERRSWVFDRLSCKRGLLLKFPYVYVAGMEENIFPSGGSFSSPSEIEEERRLFYVALTRAKVAVNLSFASAREPSTL